MASSWRALVLILQMLAMVVEGAKRALCDNAGLEYAVFNNTQSDGGGINYSEYNSSYMKDTSVGGEGPRNLIYNGKTVRVGGWSKPCQGNFSANGSPQVVPCERYSIMYRGFLNPATTGVYSFGAAEINDIFLLWVGSPALKGWDRRNNVLEASAKNLWPAQTQRYIGSNATFLYLTAGQYYPIRMVVAQFVSNMVFRSYINNPLGSLLVGPQSTASDEVVQYSCDGQYYYPNDWGREV